MKRFYSRETGCTYLESIHFLTPDDAVFIPEERYNAVIANPPLGKLRAHDERGLPYLVDAPEPLQDLAEQERRWRDGKLSAMVGLRDRHRDQIEIKVVTTLSADQFTELLVYMQALRDWPQSSDFPESQRRPTAPDWIAEQVE